jgi:hypothetical protein
LFRREVEKDDELTDPRVAWDLAGRDRDDDIDGAEIWAPFKTWSSETFTV